MSNKTISINPELFKMGGSLNKTKKTSISKKLPPPIISPNVLKNKLIKRIKEYKQNETNADNKKSGSGGGYVVDSNNTSNTNLTEYTDEFYDSIHYLNSLSKQKKLEKKQNEVILATNTTNTTNATNAMNTPIKNRTLKTYREPFIDVNIDLPDELLEIKHTPSQLIHSTNNRNTFTGIGKDLHSNQKQYNIDSETPYGCLKNGIKPTYKLWNQTKKKYDITAPTESLQIANTQQVILNDRENKLNKIKDAFLKKKTK